MPVAEIATQLDQEIARTKSELSSLEKARAALNGGATVRRPRRARKPRAARPARAASQAAPARPTRKVPADQRKRIPMAERMEAIRGILADGPMDTAGVAKKLGTSTSYTRQVLARLVATSEITETIQPGRNMPSIFELKKR